jgi:hypothetical protein
MSLSQSLLVDHKHSQTFRDLLLSVGIQEESSAEDEQLKKEKEHIKHKPKSFALGKKPAESLPPPESLSEFISTQSYQDSFDEPITINIKSMTQFITDHPHQRNDIFGQPICQRAKRKLNQHSKHNKQKKGLLKSTQVKIEATDDDVAVTNNDGDMEDDDDVDTHSSRQCVSQLESHLHHVNNESSLHQSQVDYLMDDSVETQRPWQIVKFEQVNTELPIYYLKDQSDSQFTDKQLNDMLRRKQVSLPLLTAEYENEMLQEAGYFYHPLFDRPYNFPACRAGTNCVASRKRFRSQPKDKPIIMMSLMYENEYRAFIEQETPPPSIRWCILCLRERLVEFMTHVRTLKSSNQMLGENSPAYFRFHLPREILFQMHRNSFDCEGGYYGKYMLRAESNEAIIEPICRLNKSVCEMKQNKSTGRWYYDTTPTHWKPPILPIPRCGDNIKNFC